MAGDPTNFRCCDYTPWNWQPAWYYQPTYTTPFYQWQNAPAKNIKAIEYHENGTIKRVEYWEGCDDKSV